MPATRRLFLAASGTALAAPFLARRAAAAEALKLGCLTDLNGPYADLTGKGSIGSIRLAIEDFNKLHPDIPVELVSADFNLKPDTGLAILRRWYDVDGVDAVLDFPMSALALAAVRVFEEKNKVGLVTSAATSELTRGSCGPNHIQFASDTYCLASSLVKSLVQQGGNTWFFVMPNYELGKSMVSDASKAVTESGAKILGIATYAFPGTTDFSSVLLEAQSSGAKVICLANAGEDLTNTIKQAREFGTLTGGKLLAVPFMGEPTIQSLGLAAAGGSYFPAPFYWDRDPGARAYSDRLNPFVGNQRPNKNWANAYAGAFHYLKTAAAMGVAKAKSDGRATVEAMKAMPLDDTLFGKGKIRIDGQAMHDMLLLRIKTPDQSHAPGDICQIVETLPAEQAVRPLNQGGCRLANT
ncbi:MAG TPA: ABC transporter substrate-binding protein [Acetobacteraceae bacterium]|nr:ABC transporter substrate-binding protein [Acetobacteraceae bacterium]